MFGRPLAATHVVLRGNNDVRRSAAKARLPEPAQPAVPLLMTDATAHEDFTFLLQETRPLVRCMPNLPCPRLSPSPRLLASPRPSPSPRLNPSPRLKVDARCAPTQVWVVRAGPHDDADNFLRRHATAAARNVRKVIVWRHE